MLYHVGEITSEMNSVLGKIISAKNLNNVNVILVAKLANVSQCCLGMRNPSIVRICCFSRSKPYMDVD